MNLNQSQYLIKAFTQAKLLESGCRHRRSTTQTTATIIHNTKRQRSLVPKLSALGQPFAVQAGMWRFYPANNTSLKLSELKCVDMSVRSLTTNTAISSITPESEEAWDLRRMD